MPTLQVQLLGTFNLTHDGEPVMGIHQARLQSLLAYLILHRKTPQSRQQLAFLFWPDTSETQAYSNLRKVLSTLRSNIPDAQRCLHIDAKVVQWRGDASIVLDVDQFEHFLAEAEGSAQSGDTANVQAHLIEAVERYTGDLLPNSYDDWIVPERERLRERFLESLAQLVELLEQKRDYSAAIRQANRLLRTDPLREETYRRLMRLYGINNHRPAALRTYHTCVAMLKRELGVDPSPPTQQAYAHLLHLETIPLVPPKRGTHARDTMVGRLGEWQQLMVAWQRAAHGHAHFVLIGGEAGIGKTRLVEELMQWVGQQGYTAAYARCYAAEGRLAYDPLSEWLRSEVFRQRVESLNDVWLVEVTRLAPQWRAKRANLPIPEPLTESWQRRHFFEAITRTMLSLPEPLLLVLDDTQWCDPETLQWLHYLLRFDLHSRLLVVGTARLEEISDEQPLRSLLRELRHGDQLVEFELAPLDAHETAQLAFQVADQSLDPEQANAIHRVTEGNPLLIQEMVRVETMGEQPLVDTHGHHFTTAQQSPLPARMRAVIESRLERLSPEARRLATLAATIGRSFTFAILRQASGEDDDRLVSALDELWQRRIVREQGRNGYDFSHDKIREVAYAGISPMRRRLLHRQVAQALEKIHIHELNIVSARIAAHYRQAGEADQAATYYLRAAHDMQFGYAPEEVMEHIQQGLAMLRDQPPSTENVALETTLYLAPGRLVTTREGWGSPNAIAAFEKARELSLASNNVAQLLRAQDYLQIAYCDSGNFSLALMLARGTLELATRSEDRTEIEGAHGALGLILLCVGELESAREHLEQAAALAAGSPEAKENPDRHLSYPGAFPHVLVLWLLGYADTAHRHLLAVLAAQEAHAGPFDLMTGYEFCVMFFHWRREWQEMQVYAQKMMAVAQQYEYTTYEWLGHLYIAAASAFLGKPDGGSILVRRSIEAVETRGIRMFLPYDLCLLAEVHFLEGNLDEAIAELDKALALTVETGEHRWEAETHRLRGEALHAQGMNEEAELTYQQALAVARKQQAKFIELRTAVSLAYLWAAQGKRQQAIDLLTPLYACFTEGMGTPDLQEAQALLIALAT